VARDESRAASTGFVLRVSGDTVWVVTTRSVLEDSTDLPPERIAVAFNGGRAAWSAAVVEVHPSADLALLRAVVRGQVIPVPEVEVTITPASGDPVVVVGFPAVSPANWQRQGLQAAATRGTMLSAAELELEIDGYGAPGASGSPVFNTAGQVIGMLFDVTANRTLQAVPASAFKPWMATP
jgi:S1-C subfamily serine protease